MLRKGPGVFREEAYNCLHIPQGDAAGLISVATARAVYLRWPSVCGSITAVSTTALVSHKASGFAVYGYDQRIGARVEVVLA